MTTERINSSLAEPEYMSIFGTSVAIQDRRPSDCRLLGVMLLGKGLKICIAGMLADKSSRIEQTWRWQRRVIENRIQLHRVIDRVGTPGVPHVRTADADGIKGMG